MRLGENHHQQQEGTEWRHQSAFEKGTPIAQETKPLKGDKKGDIRIQISIENSTEFLRQGLDIILKKTITLKEALCGFLLEFVFLNGKKMAINNKDNYSIIKPGFKKVIQGMGLKRENATGSFIIDFDIKFPDSLPEETLKQLQELL